LGLKPNEEIIIKLGQGKNTVIKYLKLTEPDELGQRLVFFKLNGQIRIIPVRDLHVQTDFVVHQKASAENHVGAPLQGSLSRILVKEGDDVQINTPLFTIEAMKMESTITSTRTGKVKRVHLTEKTIVEQDDLIVEFE
jgi:pyruvate carboxylase